MGAMLFYVFVLCVIREAFGFVTYGHGPVEALLRKLGQRHISLVSTETPYAVNFLS